MSKLLALALVLLISVGTLAGSTIAWFTDSVTSQKNIIKSGTLDIELQERKGNDWVTISNKDDEVPALFTNELWEPGYTTYRVLRVANNGSLALKWKAEFRAEAEDLKLAEAIEVYVNTSAEISTPDFRTDITEGSDWKLVGGTLKDYILGLNSTEEEYFAAGKLAGKTGAEPVTGNIGIALHMKETAGNEYQGLSLSDIYIRIAATQDTVEEDSFNNQYDALSTYDDFEKPNGWNGTAEPGWYNDTDTEFVITTAEQLAGFAELVNGGNTFEDKTVKLGENIDLYCKDTTPAADGDPVTFRPIGDHNKGGTFEGVFDGQGYTISNLYQNGWDLGYDWDNYGSYGLFGNVNNATIKNLTLSGGESYIEGGDVSFVAGSATGTCVFENITIKDSIAATYNNGCGGIIGWSGAGNYTFKDITIEDDVVLAGLWGSFDSSIGGIVGQGEPGATYNFENVEINCRIDAYNDCTASYDYYNYRMCGMIIGRLEETTTIDGVNYPDTSKYNITCKNVTVNYGEWMNYHYCEPTPGHNNGRGMRVEPGYQYGGLPEDYDHSQCVDNHMNLIPFDQIFGGDQLAVKGLKTYDGVKVNYPD